MKAVARRDVRGSRGVDGGERRETEGEVTEGRTKAADEGTGGN